MACHGSSRYKTAQCHRDNRPVSRIRFFTSIIVGGLFVFATVMTLQSL